MLFQYTGIAPSGSKTKGTVEAESYSEALNQLKEKKILVSSLKQVGAQGQFSLTAKQPGYEDFEYITSELSLLLSNGVRVDKALRILSRAKAGSHTGDVIQKILEKINKGHRLSEAFGQFPDYFDELYVNLIRIGEETATLPEVFNGLSEDMKFKVALTKKIKGAIAYPLVILVVCVLSIVFIFNFVVPNLAVMFEDAQNLPMYTQAILSLSDWFINYQQYLLVALVAAGGVMAYYWRNPKFSAYRSNLMAEFPGLRELFTQTQRIKFCSSVVLMLKAGVKIDVAVAHACNNVKSSALKKEINFALTNLKQGEAISSALSASRLFPDYYLSLLEVGEQSARLDMVFQEINDRSKSDFESSVSKAITLIEPILILVMGGIVGGVVVTMMLSITSVSDVGF